MDIVPALMMKVETWQPDLLAGICFALPALLGFLTVLMYLQCFFERRMELMQRRLRADIEVEFNNSMSTLENKVDLLLEKPFPAQLQASEIQDMLETLQRQLQQAIQGLQTALDQQNTKESCLSNLAQTIQCILQSPAVDEHSPLTLLRKLYLSLQPTKLLSQQAATQVTQTSLDELQGSLQQWLEGEVCTRVNTVIDLQSKVQVELATLVDATGPDWTMRTTASLQEIGTSLAQATDSRMELASQLHAVMNHVKQACSLVTNFRNEAMPSIHQIQGMANAQWGQADSLSAIQELTAVTDERSKRQSDTLKAVQQQLDKVQARLTPPMPTKAPPPTPPTTPATTTKTTQAAASPRVPHRRLLSDSPKLLGPHRRWKPQPYKDHRQLR